MAHELFEDGGEIEFGDCTILVLKESPEDKGVIVMYPDGSMEEFSKRDLRSLLEHQDSGCLACGGSLEDITIDAGLMLLGCAACGRDHRLAGGELVFAVVN